MFSGLWVNFLKKMSVILDMFCHHKRRIHSREREVIKRLVAQNVAEINPLGVSVQPRIASGGHF